MAPGREANSDNLGKHFHFLHKYCMLSVLIRIASMRRFLIVHTTYKFMIKYEAIERISLGLKNKVELAIVNEPSVSELLKRP